MGHISDLLDYLSPEMIFNLGHDKATDVWSAGVLLYEMVMAVTPFAAKRADNFTELFTNIALVKVYTHIHHTHNLLYTYIYHAYSNFSILIHANLPRNSLVFTTIYTVISALFYSHFSLVFALEKRSDLFQGAQSPGWILRPRRLARTNATTRPVRVRSSILYTIYKLYTTYYNTYV